VHETTKLDTTAPFANATPAQLVDALSHPNGWRRDTAQRLLVEAEEKFVKHVYDKELSPKAVPTLLVAPSDLTLQEIDPQAGFVLSRINGSWDIQSILSICPFREADCLRMIRDLLKRGVIGVS